MKKLSELISDTSDIDILGVCDDSRKVKPGYLFVATKGFHVDHYDYIQDAIDRGAVAIVSDRETSTSVPTFVVSDINSVFVEICQKFYDVRPSDFFLIGITGTDGKTTTTTIIFELLRKIKNCALIGTNGVYINDQFYSSDNTTPCVSELYSFLSLAKYSGCEVVIMEVSSEALLHDRLHSFTFNRVGYTNITEDHLNIHETLENYRNCKFKLLDLLSEDALVFSNGDDFNCKKIDISNVSTYGKSSDNTFVISNVNQMSKNVEFSIKCKEESFSISSPLSGEYNIYNLTLAFLIGRSIGVDTSYLIQQIATVSVIPGRREFLDFGQDYDILLDYAHTYNGIYQVLQSVQSYPYIITVTGAAGGREKEKRPKIGKLLLEKSTLVIFTMDDPRFESASDIIDEMVSDSREHYLKIIDRKEAIGRALSLATKGSIVLILGKGRDNYMAIGDQRIDYSDLEVIQNYFKNE